MRKYGKFEEDPVPLLDYESKLRLLKTHSHTSERPGYETRKNVEKVIEGIADTILRQTTRQDPAAYRQCGGGARPEGENQHETERWHNPRSREGGGVPSSKRIAKRNKMTCITKKIRQKIQSCATV